MNKQRFLAELRRLLVFMTAADRELTIEKYGAMFDQAGEDGAEALAEELGSPTKLAITLSRGYVPGQLATETRQREALKKAEKKAREGKSVSADDYDPGDLGENDPVALIMRSLEEAAGPEEDEEEDSAPEEEYAEDEDEDEDDTRRPTAYRRVGAPVSPGLGRTLLALILLVVGVPLALLTLAVVVLWLIPGAAGVMAAGLAAIGGLWCLNYIADTLLLFGLAFVILAAALLLLFCGVWLDSKLVKLYIRGVSWLCDRMLGRKVAVR